MIWRAVIAQMQAKAAAEQTRIANETNITGRLNEAIRMLGETRTVKVRRRLTAWRLKDMPDAPLRHAYEYEGRPPPLPDWYERIHEGQVERIAAGGGDAPPFEDAEESRPNLEVRLGALYALERIAEDSERDHVPVMETLCAYIRENSPASAAIDLGLPEIETLPDDATEADQATRREALAERLEASWPLARRRAEALPPLRADLQTALTIIGRRGPSRRAEECSYGYRLDLRSTSFQRADLSELHLDRALMIGARMEGASLRGSRMETTNLRGARAEGADFSKALLKHADFLSAHLEVTLFRQASMEGADFARARMQGAKLFRATIDRISFFQTGLEHSELYGASLNKTLFWGARLDGASLEGAEFHRTNLEDATLLGSRMEGALLWHSNMEAADFTGGRVPGGGVARGGHRGPR
ncbi:MAG: pentapeptide repeat-containing protein [Paracoccaceae bacterium]